VGGANARPLASLMNRTRARRRSWVDKKSRLKAIEIGLKWKTDKKVFAGETFVLPNTKDTSALHPPAWHGAARALIYRCRAAAIWCVNRWKTSKDKKEEAYNIHWIEPAGKTHTSRSRRKKGKPAEGKTHKVTDVEVEGSVRGACATPCVLFVPARQWP
jgi:hypothetical protein